MGGEIVLIAMSGAILIVVLVGSVLLVRAGRRLAPLQLARQQATATLCAQRGMVPNPAPSDFAILGPIDARWFTNSFSSPDHTVAIADFTRPDGKHTQFFSVLAFTVAGVNVPFVNVTRKNLLGRVVGGPPAMELESIDFDNHFIVKAKDRRSAEMLLDPGVMQLLLDCDDVNFDMLADKVVAFVNRAGEPAHDPSKPVEFEVLFRFLDGFVTRLPAILRTEYAAAP